jgi:RNA polymerase subunit RPABC4/transcription elongation factor Spt4
VQLAGGEKRCGACGTMNPGDAIYCKECAQPLAQSEAAKVHQYRWVTGENDFAARIQTDDLPGLLTKGVYVEAGTNAVLLENGASRGVVPAGAYTMTSFSDKFKDFFTAGLPKQLTILLVKVTPTDMEFHLGGIFTKDPLKVGMTVRLQVEVAEPAKFLVNVLKGRERYSVEELRQYLYPEVVAVADAWVRSHSAQELAEDLSLKARFELALEEALKQTFAQSGLKFLQVRTVEMNLEALDHIKGIRSKYALQISETEAEAGGKKRLVDAQRELDLIALAEETAKVEDEERKAALYERMRQTVMSDKMNEIRSEAEFKGFLREMDQQELLNEKEKEDLLRTWREDSEDHQIARAYLLAKLELEQAHELRIAELKARADLEATQLDVEIELENKRLDFELAKRGKIYAEEVRLERQRLEIQAEKAKAELELQRLQVQQKQLERQAERTEDEEDAMMGMRILNQMKEIRRLDEEERRRIARDDELAREKAKMEIEVKRFELEERRRAAEHQFELDRIKQIATLSAEQLVSISPVEQGKVIVELQRTKALKDMSEEQILALAAEKSPEVARAFQERYRAMAEGTASEREKELYERLLGEQKGMLDLMQTEADKRVKDVNEANIRAQDTARHAMDNMADTAKAFAQGSGNQPVIVVGGQGQGGTQVIHPSGGVTNASQNMGTKTCVKCGRAVDADVKHCPYCGNKFEGV